MPGLEDIKSGYKWLRELGAPFWFFLCLLLDAGQTVYANEIYIRNSDIETFRELITELEKQSKRSEDLARKGAKGMKVIELTNLRNYQCGAIKSNDMRMVDHWQKDINEAQKRIQQNHEQRPLQAARMQMIEIQAHTS